MTWQLSQNSEDETNPTYTLTISGTGAMADYTNGKQPWYQYQTAITNINVNDGVIYIGDHAFRGTRITAFKIPASVKNIGNYALIQNKELASVSISSDNKSESLRVEDDVIYKSYMRSDGSIGWELSYFPIAKYTEEYTVPSFVTAIGANALQMAQCQKVTVLSPCSINAYAFSGNSALETVVLPDGVTFGTEGVNIGSGFDGTFYGCTNLANVENFINANIYSIGDRVFNNTKVNDLLIPNTVTIINSGSFATDNGNFVSIIFEADSQLTTVAATAFTAGKYNAKFVENDIDAYLNFVSAGLKAQLGDKVLPINDTFIFEWSGVNTLSIIGVAENAELNDVKIPDEVNGYAVTKIADEAFMGNTAITSVTFEPGASITVGEKAFYNCSSMISFNTGMREIFLGNNALGSCTALKMVYIPNAQALGHKIFTMTNNVNTFLINSDVSCEYDSFKRSDDRAFVTNGTVYITGQTEDEIEKIASVFHNEQRTYITKLVMGLDSKFPPETNFEENILAYPIRIGHVFRGWYDNINYDGETASVPTPGKTYYAKWEEKKDSSISFNNSLNLDKVYDGKAVSISENDYSIIGDNREVTFYYQIKNENGTWKDIDTAPINVGTYQVKGIAVETDTYKSAETIWKEFTISKADPVYKVPTGLTAIEGQSLMDVKLPSGFTWKDELITSVGNPGNNTFIAIYTPSDTINYKIVEVQVTITVTKIEKTQTNDTVNLKSRSDKNTAVEAVKTGDSSYSTLVNIFLVFLSLLGLGKVAAFRARRNQNNA